jgi:PAS domain S-box-containing protein
LIVDSATDFAIFTFGANGAVTSWNAGAERLLGHKEREIIGRSADVIFTPEDRDAGAPTEERRKASTDGRAENERWHMRRDGSRFWGSGAAMPLRGAEGFVKIMRDLTERHTREERLRQSEAEFRLLATSIPQLVFRCGPDGSRTWASPQWSSFSGLSSEPSLQFGWLEAVHPDDRKATLDAWHAASVSGEHYSEQRVRRAADGEYRWHQMRARPIEDPNCEWVGTMADIHELKALEGRQAVLIAELHHRTRNLLAVVQSIASQTMRSAESLPAFAAEFESRLRALSRVQGLLARVEQQDVDLREIVEAELAAHGDGKLGTDKVSMAGPSVLLPATSAQAIALALHELATNAVKHGALAQPSGRLDVSWRVDQEPECRIALQWRESGVAMPEGGRPARRGYGTELIERALRYQLKAKTKLEFGEDGVRCLIEVPTVALRDPQHG